VAEQWLRRLLAHGEQAAAGDARAAAAGTKK
jgi:hypothetical protein